MTKNNAKCVLIVLSAALTVAFSGCSKIEKIEKPSPYADWKLAQYENIKVFYPEGHLHEAQMPSVAEGYTKAIQRDCAFLGINVPTETLVVYYYTGFGQGKEMTGSTYPFVRDTVIYYWQPSWLGPSLMEYLLPKFSPQKSRFPFLPEGLKALFDYSGQDWHKRTLDKIDSAVFIGLDSLASDQSVCADTERVLSAPAASFDNFVVAQYGINIFRELYLEQVPFDQAVEQIFKVDVDSLQALWIAFIREGSKPPDTTQTDTTREH